MHWLTNLCNWEALLEGCILYIISIGILLNTVSFAPLAESIGSISPMRNFVSCYFSPCDSRSSSRSSSCFLTCAITSSLHPCTSFHIVLFPSNSHTHILFSQVNNMVPGQYPMSPQYGSSMPGVQHYGVPNSYSSYGTSYGSNLGDGQGLGSSYGSYGEGSMGTAMAQQSNLGMSPERRFMHIPQVRGRFLVICLDTDWINVEWLRPRSQGSERTPSSTSVHEYFSLC
jgi:hypothetical protein